MEINADRLFAAFLLSPQTISWIAEIIGRQRLIFPDWRWIDPGTAHLTLIFFGLAGEPEREEIGKVFNSISGKYGPMTFSADEFGGFPAKNNFRVLFLSVRQISGKSALDFQLAMEEKLSRAGLYIDKRIWHPHITLARADRRSEEILPKNDFSPAEFTLREFGLLSSQPNKAGAVYKLREKYVL